MARIVIEGLKPYDGEYELDPDRAFNAREWRWIKTISGYLPMSIKEGFAGIDPTLWIALAVIGLCRDNKITREDGLRVADVLSEAYAVTITLVGDEDEQEDDALPPALTSEPDEQSPKSSLSKKNSTEPNQNLSGMSSETGSVTSDETPPATGPSSSPTLSEESTPVRLAS